MKEINFTDLNIHELQDVNGGGGLGRFWGWIRGVLSIGVEAEIAAHGYYDWTK